MDDVESAASGAGSSGADLGEENRALRARLAATALQLNEAEGLKNLTSDQSVRYALTVGASVGLCVTLCIAMVTYLVYLIGGKDMRRAVVAGAALGTTWGLCLCVIWNASFKKFVDEEYSKVIGGADGSDRAELATSLLAPIPEQEGEAPVSSGMRTFETEGPSGTRAPPQKKSVKDKSSNAASMAAQQKQKMKDMAEAEAERRRIEAEEAEEKRYIESGERERDQKMKAMGTLTRGMAAQTPAQKQAAHREKMRLESEARKADAAEAKAAAKEEAATAKEAKKAEKAAAKSAKLAAAGAAASAVQEDVHFADT